MTTLLPGYRPQIATDYGVAAPRSDGWLHLTATWDELDTWSRRRGARWFLSTLARCHEGVAVTYAPNGDLLDLTDAGGGEYETDGIDAHELAAWMADVCRVAGIIHPAIREG